MKSVIKENFGYIAIAIVVALTLVLSVAAIDTYQNKDIVANAAIDVPYPSPEAYLGGYIPSLEDYDLLSSSSFAFGSTITEYTLGSSVIYSDGYIPMADDVLLVYIPSIGSNGYYYPMTCHSNAGSELTYGGIVVAKRFSQGTQATGSTLVNTSLNLIKISSLSDGFNFQGLLFQNYFTGTYQNTSININVFLLRPKVDSSSSTADSFFALMGDGITFGFESISQGITYTMDNLFFEDGSLSDFSIIIFLMTGISLALAVLKYVLNFIFTFGGKN